MASDCSDFSWRQLPRILSCFYLHRCQVAVLEAATPPPTPPRAPEATPAMSTACFVHFFPPASILSLLLASLLLLPVLLLACRNKMHTQRRRKIKHRHCFWPTCIGKGLIAMSLLWRELWRLFCKPNACPHMGANAFLAGDVTCFLLLLQFRIWTLQRGRCSCRRARTVRLVWCSKCMYQSVAWLQSQHRGHREFGHAAGVDCSPRGVMEPRLASLN